MPKTSRIRESYLVTRCRLGRRTEWDESGINCGLIWQVLFMLLIKAVKENYRWFTPGSHIPCELSAPLEL